MSANLTIIAAEIARRIPEMAHDSPINNATVIENLLREEFQRADETIRTLREWGGRCQDEMEHQAKLHYELRAAIRTKAPQLCAVLGIPS